MFYKDFKALPVCLLMMCSYESSAAIVHLSGDTVDFYYDDAVADMAAYGELTVAGDAIFATPSEFLAEASGAGASDMLSALGTITIVAKTGYQFDGVNVVQNGDYRLIGSGANVSVTGDLTVEDSTNAGTSDATVLTNSGLGINDGSLRAWTASGQFDLSTATWDGVSSIDLSLEAILMASTVNNGELAFIQNKFVAGNLLTIETSVIPVPAAVWLFGSGLLGLAAVARRKQS